MSRLTLLVFLVALTAISIVHSGKGKCRRRVGRGGWAGKCFKTEKQLSPAPKCDALIYNVNINGCPKHRPACCVTDCNKQTAACKKRYNGSKGKNKCECDNEFQMGEVRPDSGCKCCKICKRNKRCRRTRHYDTHCITQDDPKFNVTWCLTYHVNPTIRRKGCNGWGCWCCRWPRIE